VVALILATSYALLVYEMVIAGGYRALLLVGAALAAFVLHLILRHYARDRDGTQRQANVYAGLGVAASAFLGWWRLPDEWVWLLIAVVTGFITGAAWWERGTIRRLLTRDRT
jgi:hypothetical protein